MLIKEAWVLACIKKVLTNLCPMPQLPDRETWNPAKSSRIPGADKWRIMMKGACLEIKTEHELEVVVDLLKDKPSK